MFCPVSDSIGMHRMPSDTDSLFTVVYMYVKLIKIHMTICYLNEFPRLL